LNKIIWIIVIFLLAVSLSIGEAADKPCFCLSPETSVRSSDFELDDIHGNTISLYDYKGKVVLIHFWATWCIVCALEIPALNDLWDKYKDKDLVIIAVAEDSLKSVKPFVEKYKMKYPVLIDQYGGVKRSYNVRALPSSFIIDKNGNIHCIAIGARDWRLNTIDSYIKNLLGTLIGDRHY